MSTTRSPSTVRMTSEQGVRLVVRLESLRVRVLSGADAGLDRFFALPVLRIGTGPDNDLVLTDRTVSRSHLEVRLAPEGIHLRDLGSTNGTFVGEARIKEGYLVTDGQCRLGQVKIELHVQSQERHGHVGPEDHLGPLTGSSPAMRELYAIVRAVAPTAATVLLTGESGTGKEMVARAIHELSGRPGPLVVFDAASTDREMMRSELFGHRKGAFTGAQDDRLGAFRKAHRGTLFLDELGELPLELQPRLLRTLETREVSPLGCDDRLPVDVRVVAATNRDLQAMVKAGTFREDLFHRLCVVPVQLPPLRQRADDIPLLVQRLCEQLNLSVTLPPETLEALCRHPWPGNVRALRNALERAAILGAGREVRPSDLGIEPPRGPVQPEELQDLERQAILRAMRDHSNNKTAAARALGISISTLKRRLRQYGVTD
ncbi:MAG: sigma 54-dependent Fis family transcriptional regulator [Candidatus Riflebacteria bacterium]|nr:sigma 54-dependent Fis family transcriptional regulator [Candidatus Riflebacteria bacterium]